MSGTETLPALIRADKFWPFRERLLGVVTVRNLLLTPKGRVVYETQQTGKKVPASSPTPLANREAKRIGDEIQAAFLETVKLRKPGYLEQIIDQESDMKQPLVSIDALNREYKAMKGCTIEPAARKNLCVKTYDLVRMYLRKHGIADLGPTPYQGLPPPPPRQPHGRIPVVYEQLPASKFRRDCTLHEVWAETKIAQQAAVKSRFISAAFWGPDMELGLRVLTYAHYDDVKRAVLHAARIGDGLELFPSELPDGGTGKHGLFATQAYPQNALFTEFDGERVTAAEAIRLRNDGHFSHVAPLVPGLWYVHGLWASDGAAALGHGGGSFARANLLCAQTTLEKRIVRCTKRAVNAEIVVVTTMDNALAGRNTDPGKAHVMLLAVQSIAAGEEIFVAGSETYEQFTAGQYLAN